MSGNEEIWVVDEHQGSRESLCNLLESDGQYATTGFENARNLPQQISLREPACVLLDLQMVECDAFQLLADLAVQNTATSVIATTACPSIPSAVRATQLGACNYIEKPIDVDVLNASLDQAIAIYREKRQGAAVQAEVRQRVDTLTPREKEVLELVVEGLSSKEIASALYLSSKTVSLHRAHIMKKMDARSVAHLVRMVTCQESNPLVQTRNYQMEIALQNFSRS